MLDHVQVYVTSAVDIVLAMLVVSAHLASDPLISVKACLLFSLSTGALMYIALELSYLCWVALGDTDKLIHLLGCSK